MPDAERYLEDRIPGLEGRDYQITGPADEQYNCVAWVLGDTSRRWDPYPEQNAYWPSGLPRDDSIDTFLMLFESQGFERCERMDTEPGFEKIAVFGEEEYFTHVALQLPNGRWSSKLGNDVVIEHELYDLTRRRSPFPQYRYGAVVGVMRRP